MAVQNPPLFLQASSHSAEDFRQMAFFEWAERGGVIQSDTTYFAVTEHAGTPNMSVDVAAGAAIIKGTEASFQGSYFVEARTLTNLSISAADATNARYDLIVAKVQDSGYSGGTDAWSLAVVQGTPAATPTYPTQPANSIVLAVVNVTAALASVTNAKITDLRAATASDGVTTLGNLGYAAPLGGIVVAQSSYPPAVKAGRMIFETDTSRVKLSDGSSFVDFGSIGADRTYTPAITQSGSVTLTVNKASYQKIGRRVRGNVIVTATGAGSANNIVYITVPTTIAANTTTLVVGSGYFYDASATTFYPLVASNDFSTSTRVQFMMTNGTTLGNAGSAFSSALANGDILSFCFDYEATS